MKLFGRCGRGSMGVAEVAALLVAGFCISGCEGAAEDASGVEQVREAIINGTTVTTDTVGTPLVSLTDPLLTTACSGTIIRSDLLLTAHHCVTQHASSTGGTPIAPGNLKAQILNGSSATGRFIVRHPTLDVALVKLTNAPTGPGGGVYSNWIYLGSNATQVSQTVLSQGWGVNVVTQCTPTVIASGGRVLRSAFLTVASLLPGDLLRFYPNASGQIDSYGESGSGMFVQVAGYQRPIGVSDYAGCSPQDTQAARSDAFRGWFQGVAGFGPRYGNGTGYERSDGTSAVMYLDGDDHVKEISNATGGWTLGDFTALFGGPPAMAESQLSPYVRADGLSAVVYEGTDRNIYEYALANNTWTLSNLTSILGLQPAITAPATYVRSDNVSADVFLGTDFHIYELGLPRGGQWLVTDLTAATGAPPPRTPPIGYVRSDGTNAVVYNTVDNHVIELSLGSSGWIQTDLTAVTGAPPCGGTPRPYTRSDGYSSVVYRATDNHIDELFLMTGTNTWYWGDETASAGCSAVALFDPSPFVRNDNWNSVLFLTPDSHSYELSLAPGAGHWQCHDLTTMTGAPISESVPEGYVGADRSTNVIMKAFSGDTWSFTLTTPGTNSWTTQDLTAIAGGP